MILLILGVLDIVIGISLVMTWTVTLLGMFALLKGLWSLLSSIVSGFWFDVLGLIDVLAGISLLLGWSIPLLWLFVIAKGFWSIMMSYAS